MRSWVMVFAVVLLVSGCPLVAMDYWAALSELESGNDDCAVGAAGEISRYQIRQEVWRRLAPAEADWQNPHHACTVAWEIMKERCRNFERAYSRPPTPFEFYVLWNAPAQILAPSPVVRERAERFVNLVSDTDTDG
ncbi:MAG TPA: hypothetical protein VNZ22_13040 [Bacillota bacterium]|nr:hypothetical protein [Bacillota bacterium]